MKQLWDTIRSAAAILWPVLLVIALAGVLGIVASHAYEHLTRPAPEPVVTLPAEKKVTRGRIVHLKAATECKYVEWHACEGVDLIPQGHEAYALVTGPDPHYEVHCWTAAGNVPSKCATCKLIVEGPMPPAPPGPVPPRPPVDPTDPFYPTLKAAWLKDTGTKDARGLAALYRQAQKTHLLTEKTVGEFSQKMHESVSALVGKDGMPGTRRALADEMNRNIKVKAADPMTPVLQGQFADQMNRFAGLVDALP